MERNAQKGDARLPGSPVGETVRPSITTDMFNYSFRPPMKTKLGLFTRFGFEHVHWCDDWNENVYYETGDIENHMLLLKEAGLRCLDVHGSSTVDLRIDSVGPEHEGYVRLLENRIRFCSVVGGDSVVIHPPGSMGKALELSTRVIDRVKPLCVELGVTLAVENTHKNSAQMLDFYFERYPVEFVGFCFDSGHSNIAKDFNALMRFGDRLKALHLHDNRGKRDDHQPPFFGTIDWPKTMRWIGESGYPKPINFEITHNYEFFKGPMEEYLEHSAALIGKALEFV